MFSFAPDTVSLTALRLVSVSGKREAAEEGFASHAARAVLACLFLTHVYTITFIPKKLFLVLCNTCTSTLFKIMHYY